MTHNLPVRGELAVVSVGRKTEGGGEQAVGVRVTARSENEFGLVSFVVDVATLEAEGVGVEPVRRVVSSGRCLRLSHALTYAEARAKQAGVDALYLAQALKLAGFQAAFTVSLGGLAEAKRLANEKAKLMLEAQETLQRACLEVEATVDAGVEVLGVCRRRGGT